MTSRLVEFLKFKAVALPEHTPVERFVLDHGKLMRGRHLPKGFERGVPKLCFMNAAELAFANPALAYVEGFGARDRLPLEFHHAWCLDPRGRVVDPTWRFPSAADEYMGVAIPTPVLGRELARLGSYGVLMTMRGPNTPLLAELLAGLGGMAGAQKISGDRMA